MALGPTRVSTHKGGVFLGVKRKGCEADHLPPSTAEIKHEWSCTSSSLVRFHAVTVTAFSLANSKTNTPAVTYGFFAIRLTLSTEYLNMGVHCYDDYNLV